MKNRLDKLLSIKSLVTLAMTVVFCTPSRSASSFWVIPCALRAAWMRGPKLTDIALTSSVRVSQNKPVVKRNSRISEFFH